MKTRCARTGSSGLRDDCVMIASAQERQPDLDDGSAFGASPEVQDAAIRRNRRLDDREAQT